MTLLSATRTNGRSLAIGLTVPITLATKTAKWVWYVPFDRNPRAANFNVRRKYWRVKRQNERIGRFLVTVTIGHYVSDSADSLGLQLTEDLVVIAIANITTMYNTSTRVERSMRCHFDRSIDKVIDESQTGGLRMYVCMYDDA